MPVAFEIRPETPSDSDAITAITEAAFAPLEISDQTEHLIIKALRAADALTLSLVAEGPRGIIGHIAFSPISFSDGTMGWFGLGPVSVLPDHQGQGIGGALIRAGLAELRKRGARGCCLIGHPGYYGRFGFKNSAGLSYPDVPAEALFALSLDGSAPQGRIHFHDAFLVTP